MNLQSGRVRLHFVTIGGIVCLALIGFIFLFASKGPTEAASDFMFALKDGNVNRLCELSYFPGDKEKLRKQWEFAVNDAGKYYVYTWQFTGTTISDSDTAAVAMAFMANADQSGSPESRIQLPMVKENGVWKVDVKAITSEMYPALPR